MKTVIDLVNLIKDKFSMRKDIAPVETSSTASRAYKAGEEFYYGNLLQRATQDITQGSGLAGGVNFENADPVAVQVVSVKETLTNQINDNGSKNVVPNGAYTQTVSSATFTVNSDKTITQTTNVSSSNADVLLGSTILKKGTYVISDGIHSTTEVDSTSRYVVYVQNSSNTWLARSDGRSSLPQTFTLSEDTAVKVFLRVYVGYGNGLTYKPMICLASDYALSSDYEPPAMTNRQLTTDKVGMDLLSEVGGVNYFNNTGTTQGVKGVTFTVGSDKKVTATGNNDGTGSSNLIVTRVPLKKGTYMCSGSPSGGSSTTYGVNFDVNSSSNNWDYGDGRIITLASDGYVDVYMHVHNGYSISGSLVFAVMITPVSYNGPYVPYAKSNKQLTDDVTPNSYTPTVSGFKSFEVNKVLKIGAIKNFMLNAYTDGAKDAGTSIDLFYLDTDYRPQNGNVSKEILLRDGVSGLFYISANSGKVSITPRTAIADNKQIAINEFFI